MKKLILIDGNSLVYRAFYAIPLTIARAGEPVNAVYGFTSMLIKLIKDEQPAALAVAFDRKAPTFRHNQFAEYKAQRPEMPDELKPQFELVKEVIEAFDIPFFELDGYEADDVIATLVKKLESTYDEILIVTADRDALQLVTDKVKVISTRKGISEVKIYDRQKVIERFGLPPEKMPDMLGLAGETSDNIPGVPGIGEKTAISLIREFGFLEQVLEKADEIKKPKLRELLKNYGEQALLSKELSTLHSEVPLEVEEKSLRFSPNWQKVQKTLAYLSFNSLLKRLEEEKKMDLKQLKLPTFRLVDPLNLKDVLFDADKCAIAFEVEGDWNSGFLKSAYFFTGENGYKLDFSSLTRMGAVQLLRDYLVDESKVKIVHGLKDKLHYLFNEEIEEVKSVFDPQLAVYLLQPEQAKQSMVQLAETFLKLHLEEEKKEKDAEEAFLSFQLYPILKKEIKEKKLDYLYYQVELPLAKVLMEMERTGVLLNLERLKELKKEMEVVLESMEKEIYQLVGVEFNINSPQQVSEVLYNKLNLKAGKRRQRAFATDFSALIKLINAHPVVEKILAYREVFKLKTTYVDVLPTLVHPKTGRVHTQFNQVGTATGRLSSSNPNLQNIPIRSEWGRRIREAFIAPPGFVLLSADYSQIDLRVLAHLSEDKKLVEAFKNKEDIHTRTACELFSLPPEKIDTEKRRIAKAVNFGLVYGMSAQGLAEQLLISREVAQEYIERYFSRHPGVKKFIDETIAQAYQNGYVKTIFGRRRYLPELKSDNIRIRNFGERLAVNTPVQGSSADIVKIAMVNLAKELKKLNSQNKMILQVHDELLLEVPEEDKERIGDLVKKAMENACSLKVDLQAELAWGENWNDAK